MVKKAALMLLMSFVFYFIVFYFAIQDSGRLCFLLLTSVY